MVKGGEGVRDGSQVCYEGSRVSSRHSGMRLSAGRERRARKRTCPLCVCVSSAAFSIFPFLGGFPFQFSGTGFPKTCHYTIRPNQVASASLSPSPPYPSPSPPSPHALRFAALHACACVSRTSHFSVPCWLRCAAAVLFDPPPPGAPAAVTFPASLLGYIELVSCPSARCIVLVRTLLGKQAVAKCIGSCESAVFCYTCATTELTTGDRFTFARHWESLVTRCRLLGSYVCKYHVQCHFFNRVMS